MDKIFPIDPSAPDVSEWSIGFDPYNTDYIKMIEALELICKDELTMSGEVARKVIAEIRKPDVDAVKVFNKEEWDAVMKEMYSKPIQFYRSDPLKPVRDKLDELIKIYLSAVDDPIFNGLFFMMRLEASIITCEQILGLPESTFPLTKADTHG